MERLKLNIQRFAGPTNINLGPNGNMFGHIRWDSTVQGSTAAEKAQLNKSKVNGYLYVTRTDGLTTWGDFTGNININGTNRNFSVNLEVGNSWVFVGQLTDVEVPHNADGSKSITISGSVTGPSGTTWEGKTVSGSGTAVLDKIPRYAISVQSLNSKTETSIKMNWSSDSTCDYVWYSTNNGSSWTAVGSVNATSGSYTISGLTANTTYNIKTRVRRKDSQLTTDSSASAIATYNYPNCTSAPNFTIGNSVTLQFYNPLNRTFDIRMWSFASESFVSDSITINGTSYTFTPDASTLYASIPNVKSSVYNIDSTYSGHKIVKTGGSYSVNETTSKPTFNDFTYEDTNSTTLALTGDSSIVVQNYSNVRARVSVANKAVAQNGTTMKQYNLVIGNAPQVSANYSDDEEVITPEVNNSSSNIINLYAEDNRGLTTLVSKTAVLKAYTNIQKGNISIARAGNVGKSVTLTFNGTFWNESFGDVTNAITSVQYRYKTTSSSQWSSYISITPPTSSDNNYSFSGGIAGDLGNEGFTVENSFNIEVVVSDRLSSTTFTVVLGTGTPLIAKHNNGVAIKQPYDTTDDSVLQVNGKTHIKGNVQATSFNNYILDLLTNDTTNTWVPVLENGTLKHRVIPTAMNSTLKFLYHQGNAPSNLNDAKTHGTYHIGGTYTNAPTTSSMYGILEVYVSNGNTWVPSDSSSWIWQKIYLTNGEIYMREGVNSATMSAWHYIGNEIFKFRKFEKSMTIGANGMTSIDMGAINVPSGYSYLGTLPIQCGYSDQWVVSFSNYDTNHIIATGHSKYGVSLTHNVSCYVVYIRNDIKSRMIL